MYRVTTLPPTLLTGMAEYLAANPQFAVNGFIRSGIANALDHNDNDSSIVESPITIAVDDDEDSDYQIDSDSEDDNQMTMKKV